MEKTLAAYKLELDKCRDIFMRKTQDYGASWRIMRIPSLIDQVFIKAQRIRSIEEKGEQKVGDPIESEYLGIVNYCIITLIQMELGESMEDSADNGNIFALYDVKASEATDLMLRKNHDYGEAWRDMWISSLTDLILSKVMRIRQIITNKGKTEVSEGIDANLYDMINYALFAMIRLQEEKK